VGFDNEYVMTHRLGKCEEEIRQLYECGALGKWTTCAAAGHLQIGTARPA